MKCHEVDYTIIGDDMQMVEVELDPGETVIAEAGAMNYMEPDIVFEARMGDGSEAESGIMGKLFGAGKRALTGESIFMTHFSNQGGVKRHVAFAAPYPGKIIPMDLAQDGRRDPLPEGRLPLRRLRHQGRHRLPAPARRRLLRRRGLHPAAPAGRRHGLHPRRRHHHQARAAGRNAARRYRLPGRLRADGIDYDIERAGNLKSMFFGGEGLFLATLSGHGRVWLQSLPFSRLADRILAHAPKAGGKEKGED